MSSMSEPATATDSVSDQGVLSRAIGVIVSPTATFKGVVARPRPAGILLLVCVLIALAAGLPQFTERGQQASLDAQVQQIERSGGTVTPEMYQRLQTFVRYSGYVVLASVFIMTPVLTMLFAALFWFIFNALLGGMATFRQVLAVTAHAQVIGALGAILGAPIMYFQGAFTATGPFNLGVLVPMLPADSFLVRFLSAISFFMLWQIVVTAIGLGVLYRRKATGIAIALTAIYLVLIGGVMAVIPGFGGR